MSRSRRRTALALVAAVALAAGLAGSIAYARWRRVHVPECSFHLARLTTKDHQGIALHFLEDGRLLAAVAGNEAHHECVEVWSLETAVPTLVRVIELDGFKPFEVDRGGEQVTGVTPRAAGIWVSRNHPFSSRLISARTGETSLRLDRAPRPERPNRGRRGCTAVVSADGRLLAVETVARTIEIRRVATGEVVARLDLPVNFTGFVGRLFFAPGDDAVVLENWNDGEENVTDGAWIAPISSRTWRSLPAVPGSLGRVTRDGDLVQWESTHPATVRRFGIDGTAHDVALAPARVTPAGRCHGWIDESGDYLVRCRLGSTGPSVEPDPPWLEVVSIRSGEILAQFEPPEPVVTIALSPSGDRLATIRADATVNLWDVSR